jgi:hypothetical protein
MVAQNRLEVLKYSCQCPHYFFLLQKPSVIEAQPIPQLTSSGHSIHNSKSNSSWNEDFPYGDAVVSTLRQEIFHYFDVQGLIFYYFHVQRSKCFLLSMGPKDLW